jgi:hypothetical protein
MLVLIFILWQRVVARALVQWIFFAGAGGQCRMRMWWGGSGLVLDPAAHQVQGMAAKGRKKEQKRVPRWLSRPYTLC